MKKIKRSRKDLYHIAIDKVTVHKSSPLVGSDNNSMDELDIEKSISNVLPINTTFKEISLNA